VSIIDVSSAASLEPPDIWTGIFYALTGSTGMVGTAAIDSTHIKAQRSAAGPKTAPFHHAIGRSRGGRTTKVHDADG
jgi:hypothetical protein